MSFSFSKTDVDVHEAEVAVSDDAAMPLAVKDVIRLGLTGLRRQYGETVLVNVSASGHVHNGEPDNADATAVYIHVSKSVAKQ